MNNPPESHVVAAAEQKSEDLVSSYLMNEASDVHVDHPPLVDLPKRKKKKKVKKSHHKKRRDGNKSDTTTASESGEELEREQGSPVTFLLEELRKVAPPGKSPRTFPALQMYDEFDKWTEAQKAAYDKEALGVIRSRDIDTLREWHKNGRCLQAANAYGESLLHLACRRGFLDVVEFLVEEADHSLWIRDDTGRTPLHDACWTLNPSPELVQFILDRAPDLLLISDKRGHLAFDYSRKDHWEFWVDYISKADLVKMLPSRDCFYIDTASTAQGPDGVIVDNLDDMFTQLEVTDAASSPAAVPQAASVEAYVA